MAENKILKRIFCPKTDEIAREKRILLKLELYSLYSSSDIIAPITSGIG
jgi:hypothetical protein